MPISRLRGLRTLGLRLERHQRNALRVAEWLEGRPEVAAGAVPGAAGDPGHALWVRDFPGASGLFGVVLEAGTEGGGGRDARTRSSCSAMGASFGGFESLAIPMDPNAMALGHAVAGGWSARTSARRPGGSGGSDR